VTQPLRGNVPTRLAKLESGELDAVVLAAAGLRRLGISPSFAVDLPVDRFVPAPAQGALAVQVRTGTMTESMVRAIEDADSRRAVEAERAFLRAIGAGCHVPASALATVSGGRIGMTVQMFRDPGSPVSCFGSGHDPEALGRSLAEAVLHRPMQA
jgi:hydroxymethylbilane synthase